MTQSKGSAVESNCKLFGPVNIRFTSNEDETTGLNCRSEDGRLTMAEHYNSATDCHTNPPVHMVSNSDNKLPSMKDIYSRAAMLRIRDGNEIDLTGYMNDERIAVPCVVEPPEPVEV
jgi:hypothetical protein